jgi:glyoxylase-like metal-dependent hydrolase (beta-lactamase superfamily II)
LTLVHLQNLADPDLRLTDGSLVPAQGLNLRVVTTPGHSPGHICLVDELHGLIFSGDHVLPRISPHIALELPGPANPLADYYDSLDLIGFEDEMEVYPAHEYRFSRMERRVAQLIEHNSERSAEVLRVLEAHWPKTVWDHRPAPDVVPWLGVSANLLAAPGGLRNSQPRGVPALPGPRHRRTRHGTTPGCVPMTATRRASSRLEPAVG